MGATDSPDLQPHLDGLRRGVLVVARCAVCGSTAFPPRAVCGTCGAQDAAEWFTASGRGTVWSVAVFHKTYLPDHPAPYAVLIVELAEGPRVVGAPIDALPAPDIGAAVTPQFETRDGVSRVLFRRTSS
jgi:uncharacterized OB-fold protein